MPDQRHSQHNLFSMTVGDDWIGRVVRSIEQGPQWRSTAIFITYDDCGCFSDHVSPSAGLGIRVPMVIVSPWAKPRYTDRNVASFASTIAFVERVFGLAPLSAQDAAAYDYWSAFNFAQQPLAPVPVTRTGISRGERRYLATHPPNGPDVM